MNGIFLWKTTVLSSRKYIFEKNLAFGNPDRAFSRKKSGFGSPDNAFFRKNRVSEAPTRLFSEKIGFRDSRQGFFLKKSAFGLPERAFDEKNVVSGKIFVEILSFKRKNAYLFLE